MAKKTDEMAGAFLQKNASTSSLERFEVNKPSTQNSFVGVFGSPELLQEERTHIEKILHEFFDPSKSKEEETAPHFEELCRISGEVKAINAQSVILHGERIKKAQAILSNYKERAFSTWLETFYGNRATPYNMLRYYDLYQQLPPEHQKMMHSMPRKAVYALASREGELLKKVELIENHHSDKQEDLVALIRGVFSLGQADKRSRKKDAISRDVEAICTATRAIFERQEFLEEEHREKLKEAVETLQKLVL